MPGQLQPEPGAWWPSRFEISPTGPSPRVCLGTSCACTPRSRPLHPRERGKQPCLCSACLQQAGGWSVHIDQRGDFWVGYNGAVGTGCMGLTEASNQTARTPSHRTSTLTHQPTALHTGLFAGQARSRGRPPVSSPEALCPYLTQLVYAPRSSLASVRSQESFRTQRTVCRRPRHKRSSASTPTKEGSLHTPTRPTACCGRGRSGDSYYHQNGHICMACRRR